MHRCVMVVGTAYNDGRSEGCLHVRGERNSIVPGQKMLCFAVAMIGELRRIGAVVKYEGPEASAK